MMENAPLISVIVPVYNAQDYLPQCLDCLVNQDFPRLEILCINDGSADGSLAILNKYAAQDARFRVTDQPNAGVSAARNAGLALCRGQYLLFVDADDWIDPSFCSQLYQAAQKHQADAVMCGYMKVFSDHTVPVHIFPEDCVFKGQDAVRRRLHRRLYGPVGAETSRPQDLDLPISPCMQLFSAERAKRFRFPDIRETGTFEDGLFQMDFYKNCDCFAYLDLPLYYYRKTNENSITTGYKAELFTRWQHLFDRMEKEISGPEYEEDYRIALRNRIAFSTIGLGLNEIHADKTAAAKAGALKKVLRSERYREAFAGLDFQYLPFAWKVFFLLCKKRLALPLTLMLQMIEFFRKRVR